MMFSMNKLREIICVALILGAVLGFTTSTSQAQIGRGDYVVPPNWSADGTRVAMVIGNSVEVRDAGTNQLLHVFGGHTDFIPMVAWSPDSSMIATPSYDQTVKVWNADSGELLYTLTGHNDAVVAVAWSPNGTQLLSWGFDTRPNLFVWDVTTGNLLERHNSGSIVAAAFSPDDKKLALSVSLGIGTIDAQTFEVLSGSSRIECCPNQMYSLAWSPDSSALVTGSINGLATIWDANTAQTLSQFIANPYHQPDSRDVDNLALSWVRDVTFAPDGSTVLSASGDGTLREWDAATGELVHETQIGPFYSAAWSPYVGRLAVLEPTAEEQSALNAGQVFDASNVTGTLNIVVPDPSIERLQSIAEACNASPQVDTALNATLDQVETNARPIDDFIVRVETLPQDALPPGCAADLLAVAEAIQNQQ